MIRRCEEDVVRRSNPRHAGGDCFGRKITVLAMTEGKEGSNGLLSGDSQTDPIKNE